MKHLMMILLLALPLSYSCSNNKAVEADSKVEPHSYLYEDDEVKPDSVAVDSIL